MKKRFFAICFCLIFSLTFFTACSSSLESKIKTVSYKSLNNESVTISPFYAFKIESVELHQVGANNILENITEEMGYNYFLHSNYEAIGYTYNESIDDIPFGCEIRSYSCNYEDESLNNNNNQYAITFRPSYGGYIYSTKYKCHVKVVYNFSEVIKCYDIKLQYDNNQVRIDYYSLFKSQPINSLILSKKNITIPKDNINIIYN